MTPRKQTPHPDHPQEVIRPGFLVSRSDETSLGERYSHLTFRFFTPSDFPSSGHDNPNIEMTWQSGGGTEEHLQYWYAQRIEARINMDGYGNGSNTLALATRLHKNVKCLSPAEAVAKLAKMGFVPLAVHQMPSSSNHWLSAPGTHSKLPLADWPTGPTWEMRGRLRDDAHREVLHRFISNTEEEAMAHAKGWAERNTNWAERWTGEVVQICGPVPKPQINIAARSETPVLL